MMPSELVTHYLAMDARPDRPARPQPADVELRRVPQITLSFYRYLYDEVGTPWHWHDRRLLTDRELSDLVHAEGVEIHVLYHDGCPAGFAELDFRALPDARLAYFGLVPQFIGRGLGGFFLDWAVRRLWGPGVRRLLVNTCNLDHPSALANYQRAGFVLYDTARRPNPYRTRPRYAHTNLVARDWRLLADYYIRVFDCRELPPVRDLSGPELERGTGLSGAHLQGVHLRLPGPLGPTLEIFTYDRLEIAVEPRVNRPGLAHLAFHVEDVVGSLERVLKGGGSALGEVVTTPVGDSKVTWCYTRDPEGNIVELCCYAGSGL